ncbi:unnamed protein product, partial [marine sediment metagenome]
KHNIKDVTKWMNEEVTTRGRKWTRGHRMALLNHAQNTDNLRHIIGGGVGNRYSKTPNRSSDMTAAEIGEILKSLTPAEKEFGGTPVRNLLDKQYTELNKVF